MASSSFTPPVLVADPLLLDGSSWQTQLREVDYGYRMALWATYRTYPMARNCSDKQNNLISQMEIKHKVKGEYIDKDDDTQEFEEDYIDPMIREANNFINVEGIVPVEIMYSTSGDTIFRVVPAETIRLFVGYDFMQEKTVCYAGRVMDVLSGGCDLAKRAEEESHTPNFRVPFSHLQELRLDAGIALKRAAEQLRMCHTSNTLPGGFQIDPLIVVLTGFDYDPTPRAEITSIVACFYDEVMRLRALEDEYDRGTRNMVNPKIIITREADKQVDLEDETATNQYADIGQAHRKELIMMQKMRMTKQHNEKVFQQQFNRMVMGNSPLYEGESDVAQEAYVRRMRRNAGVYLQNNMVPLEDGDQVGHVIPVTLPKEIAQVREYVDELISNLYGIPMSYTKQASSNTMKGNAEMLKETKGTATARRARLLGKMLTKLMRARETTKSETPLGMLSTYRTWLRPRMQRALVDYLKFIHAQAQEVEELRQKTLMDQERAAQMGVVPSSVQGGSDEVPQAATPVGFPGATKNIQRITETYSVDNDNAGRGNGSGSSKAYGGKKRKRDGIVSDDADSRFKKKGRKIYYGLLDNKMQVDAVNQGYNPFAEVLERETENTMRSQNTGLQLQNMIRNAIASESLQFLYYMPERAEWLTTKLNKMKTKARTVHPPSGVKIELHEINAPMQQDAQTLSAMYYGGFIPEKDCIRAGRSMLGLQDTAETPKESAELEMRLRANRDAVWAGMQKMVKEGDVDQAFGVAFAQDITKGAQQVTSYEKKKKQEKEKEKEQAAKKKASGSSSSK